MHCWPGTSSLLRPWGCPGLIVSLPVVNTVWQMGLTAVCGNCTPVQIHCTCYGFSTSLDRLCVWGLFEAGTVICGGLLEEAGCPQWGNSACKHDRRFVPIRCLWSEWVNEFQYLSLRRREMWANVWKELLLRATVRGAEEELCIILAEIRGILEIS